MIRLLASILTSALADLNPWVVRATAAAVPLALSAALGVAFTRPIPGCGARCEVTDLLDRQLAEREPRLVVVGNSMARRDVNLARLAEGLGVDPDRAVLLALPGSSPGTWYALLRYRLFQRGHAPATVIVVGAPRSFWITRPVVGADVSALVQIAGSEDPLVRRISGESGAYGVLKSRFELHRRMWRTTLVESVVRGVAAVAVRAGVEPTEDMADVFGVAGGDPGALRNLLGGTARDGEVQLARTVEESFLPAILAQVLGQEAELVVAAVPPRNEAVGEFAESSLEREKQLGEWLTRSGATWIPMDDLVLPRRVYADQWHLMPEGADLYTDALVEAIRETRAVDGG